MKQTEDRSRRRFLKASSMLGMAVAFSPETIADAFADSKSKTIQKEDSMTQTSGTQRGSEQAADKTAIRPYQFNFPDAELTDLRRRINATKWPERELVTDASQGVQLATMQKLARYWGTDYDWRKGEDPELFQKMNVIVETAKAQTEARPPNFDFFSGDHYFDQGAGGWGVEGERSFCLP